MRETQTRKIRREDLLVKCSYTLDSFDLCDRATQLKSLGEGEASGE